MEEEYQRFIAKRAISPPAMRGAAAGTLAVVRNFLANIVIREIPHDKAGFGFWLDNETAQLQHLLPDTSGRLQTQPEEQIDWGRARKALNLFLRDCLYDYCFHKHLEPVGDFLEIPLDSFVARGLRNCLPNCDLPARITIGALTSKTSKNWQNAASACAVEKGIRRVDLDVLFWGGA